MGKAWKYNTQTGAQLLPPPRQLMLRRGKGSEQGGQGRDGGRDREGQCAGARLGRMAGNKGDIMNELAGGTHVTWVKETHNYLYPLLLLVRSKAKRKLSRSHKDAHRSQH
jgi:hypothetical protein